MPELPEAEIACRQLDAWLGEGPIVSMILEDRAVLRTHLSSRPSDAVAEPEGELLRLVGEKLEGTQRHGKRFGLRVGNLAVLFHLGMSGKFVRGESPPRFARLGIQTEARTVWFCDQRRFGCISIVPVADLDASLRKGHGPDALLEAPSGSELQKRLKGRRAVKVALLDQAVLAGIGNIHAVEVLFLAKIDPRTPCASLSRSACDALALHLPQHLARVIVAESDGEIVYVTEGKRESPFAIYGREKLSCYACSTPIESFSQSGRRTFWCPSCQTS